MEAPVTPPVDPPIDPSTQTSVDMVVRLNGVIDELSQQSKQAFEQGCAEYFDATIGPGSDCEITGQELSSSGTRMRYRGLQASSSLDLDLRVAVTKTDSIQTPNDLGPVASAALMDSKFVEAIQDAASALGDSSGPFDSFSVDVLNNGVVDPPQGKPPSCAFYDFFCFISRLLEWISSLFS